MKLMTRDVIRMGVFGEGTLKSQLREERLILVHSWREQSTMAGQVDSIPGVRSMRPSGW